MNLVVKIAIVQPVKTNPIGPTVVSIWNGQGMTLPFAADNLYLPKDVNQF